MLNSIRDNLADKQESVLTELNDCFNIISATLLPSQRGFYITDNKVQCCMVVESFFPKDIVCNRAAISIEAYEPKQVEKRTPVKSYKTDLSVNVAQSNSPKKSIAETSDNESTILVNR